MTATTVRPAKTPDTPPSLPHQLHFMHSDFRPNSPGPLSSDFARQQISKQQRNNYHSSSLSKMNVNQTNLHPHGVTYVGLLPRLLRCVPKGPACSIARNSTSTGSDCRADRNPSTPSLRKNFMRLLTSTTTELPLYVHLLRSTSMAHGVG